MLALFVALALSSPVPMIPTPPCRWYSHALQACRDEDMEVIGPWDPRPSPSEWPYTTYPEPREYGAYPTEQKP